MRCFEGVVDSRPDRPAVVAADGRATFAELDRMANRLAHLIRSRGDRPDRPVLLWLEPGVRLVAAMLGVVKAGRVFVALDPTAPQERNQMIVSDAGCAVALAGGRLVPELTAVTGGAVDAVDVDHTPAGIADTRPVVEVGLDTIAALTYTSGSTGRPKGVLQSHRSILHNAGITRAALGVTPADRCTLLYPPSVNPALRDVMTSLLTGAVLLPFNVGSRGLVGLADWIDDQRVTVLCSGVTLFQQLAETLDRGARFPSVRMVKLGGEPVTRRTVELYRRHFVPPCRLYSGLGATETGTVSVCLLDHDSPLPGEAAPLGRPAPDTDITLCDHSGETVASGEPGEIVVTSEFLSPGYWRDHDLTAVTFLPVDGDTHRRRYRTGDMGRWRPDGTLEHLGRADFQVKIRGVRVQVEEVEAALENAPGVRSAAVVARPGSDGEPVLVAYVVPSDLGDLTRSDLRRSLLRRLPLPALPSVVVTVTGLPRTPNGKLDRGALAGITGQELRSQRSFAYPRDPVETRLAALWCEVLGRELVGIDEDFFEIGGDSLRAVELFSELERRFGGGLPLATLFEAPTVRQQAALVRDGVADGGLQPVVSWNRGGQLPPLFCVPAVDGYAFVYRPLAVELGERQPLHVLQFPGLDGRSPPLDTVEGLATELVRRMRTVQSRGPYLLLGHSFGGMVAYEMTRQLQAAGDRVALLAMVDSHTVDAIPLWSRAVRDAELLVHGLGRVWRESGTGGRTGAIARLATTVGTLGQMAVRGYARRRRNTLVEHTIHEVRRVAARSRRGYRMPGPLALGGGLAVLYRAAPQMGVPRLWCRFIEPSNGWARHLADVLEIHDVPGDHIQILLEPSVGVLAGLLGGALDRARQLGSIRS